MLDKMKEKKRDSIFSNLNKLCIISLFFSIIGIIKYGIICGAIANVTGIIALITFKKETQKARELTIIGIAVGATDVVMALVWSIMYSVK